MIVVHRVGEEEAGVIVVARRGLGRVGRAGVRRVGPAVGVDARAVNHPGHARGQHRPEVDAVVNGIHAVVDAGRGRGGADDQGRGIGRANPGRATTGKFHQVGHAERRSVPLALQVRLVPQFIGRHFPGVARRQIAHEPLELPIVRRRAVHLGHWAAPLRRLADTEQHLDVLAVGPVDQSVKFAEQLLAVFARPRFMELPRHLRLHPPGIERLQVAQAGRERPGGGDTICRPMSSRSSGGPV